MQMRACTKLDPPKYAFRNPVVDAAATMYQEPVASVINYKRLEQPLDESRFGTKWELPSLIRSD